MQLPELVRDICQVRLRGVGLDLRGIPALSEAVARRWPGKAPSSKRLRDLLLDAATRLEPHDAEGIRLALGLTGMGGNSRDRRDAFAAYYGRTSETVRRQKMGGPGLERESFTNLAERILELPGVADGPTALVEPDGNDRYAEQPELRPSTAASDDAEQQLRAWGDAAQQEGNFAAGATWGVALVAVIRERADATPGDYETEAELALEYMTTGSNFLMAGETTRALNQLLGVLGHQVGSRLMGGSPPSALWRR